MPRFAHYPINSRGRDFAVGDIHGHFSRLQAALDRLGFNPEDDRLFSVGDLVDRGPQSELALEWLGRSWFAAVQGNHEALAIRHVEGGLLDYDMYRASGGGWFLDSGAQRQRLFAARFAQMPIALEVETRLGLVGVVHADCPFASWSALRDYLLGGSQVRITVEEVCQWSRTRLKNHDVSGIREVRAVMVGHTPQRQPTVLGNVYHIDTAGWGSGHFTLVELGTLSLARPQA
ncbi:metallophosphoesterase [Pseudomonas agarici]|uniref:metallophosphoesterase n=1 Tax=Pseudomonas agarici TaxID=46677 RepID=UPI000307406F|nr:metallophosphoesterase [Pseudomonas agarici]NWC10453.1 metallophosphoesterase [Pseudomonas agarici]SEK24496.1 serine/threonine protein phosphatase 1 [Pseudomonas agarici]